MFNHNRRAFLKSAGYIGLTLPLSQFLTRLNALNMPSTYANNLGIQLYTVRDLLKANPKETLKAIAEAGYQQVELMDVTTQGDLLPIIEDLGLAKNSSFFDLSYVIGGWEYGGKTAPAQADMDYVIEKAANAGLTNLVFGYLYPQQREKLDQYRAITEQLNVAGEKCKNAGIQLCYHNHNFEFKKLDDGVPYEVLMERLDPNFVKFELDVFWADIAGWNPVKLMKQLGDRLHLVHLKDKAKGTPVIMDNGEVPKEAFRELGGGTVNLKKVLKQAEKMNVAHCFVEQDHSPDPIHSIGLSYQYMNKV